MKFNSTYLGLAAFVASLTLVAPACGDSKSSEDGTGDTSSGSGTAAEDDSGEWSGTAEDTSTETTSSSDSNADETTAGFVTDTGTDTGDTTGTGPQPNGSPCGADSECESETCVMIAGVGGVCSECETDQDCVDAGTGINCSLGAQQYFACTDGGLGTMCMSDEGCDGDLVCATVVDLGGLFNDQFCSECGSDSDCTDGQLCVPNFDIASFGGYRECADPGSLAQDSLCDTNEQCTSGFCSEADIMGFLQLGICGECLMDSDCAMGSCMPANVDIQGGGGLSGSTCG